VTRDEVENLLGEQLCTELREKWGPAHLSSAQIAELASLLTDNLDTPDATSVA